jgi:hypothetical protein
MKMNCKLLKKKEGKNSAQLLGNCKSPHFQYSNYANIVVKNCIDLHSTVKQFISQIKEQQVKHSPTEHHEYLYGKLKKIKGVGPLSYNQFWHSLCLC